MTWHLIRLANRTTRKAHQIAPDRLFELVCLGMVECLAVPQAEASSAVSAGFCAVGQQGGTGVFEGGKIGQGWGTEGQAG